MRDRANVFTIILIFIFLIFTLAAASGKEIVVDSNSSGDFRSIQEAVNSSFPGDRVIVKPGTYMENINVDKNLTIISESGNSSDTIVKSANGSNDVFSVWSNGVSIKGFSINGAKYAGIHLFGVTNCNITNNNLSNNGCGIDLYMFSSGNTVDNNQISDSVTGISLGDSWFNSLSNNSVSNCSNAISLFDSGNNKLQNNSIFNNSEGISLIGESNSNNLTSNIVSFNTKAGLHLYGTSNNLIYNNYFNNTANVEFDETGLFLGANIWNKDKTAGINIVGGQYLGGNFWAKPDGTGFSEISADSDGDGIGDLPYNISGNEFDYLPLVYLSSQQKPLSPVSNESGMNSSFDRIIVKGPSDPIADFSANPASGNAPLFVQFTDLSQNATGWNWDFGDGDSSTEVNPSHTYSEAGNYIVNLTVNNENGMNSKNLDITVHEVPHEEKVLPKADFSAIPTSGNAPLFVQFTDLSENANAWYWNFDDGNPSTEKNPEHTYSKAGKYTVNLIVSNENGTDSKTLDIIVNEVPHEEKIFPEADFSAIPTSGNAPLSVQFTDLSKNATQWNWDFGDGNYSTEKNPMNTYSRAGEYAVNLTVTNENGTDSKTLEVTVHEAPIEGKVPPVADFNSSSVDGLTIHFIDLSENANAWYWEFGDGTTSFERNPAHTYPSAGTYNVSLTVSNENGTNSKTLEITVHEAPNEEKVFPVANFNARPESGNAPLSVQFTDLSQSVTGRNWNFGDGETSTAKDPMHTYSKAGTYTINLTVTNENGTDSKVLEIIVHEAPKENKILPVANFNAYPTSGNTPLYVQFTDLSQNAVSRSWDFNNDGISDSSDINPTYTYTVPGTYTASLTVSNANGTAYKTAIINALEGSSSGGSSSGGNSGGSSSHSSSGGGGGGGAGGSPEPQSNVEVKELSQAFITSGSFVRFDFPQNATSVVYITFNSKKTVGKTTTIVEMLKGKSTLVSQLPSGEVYKSLNIWVGNSGFATPNNIENSVVCFKVEKSWLQDKYINSSSISLNRYSDKKWSSLPTSMLGEDSKYLYFTAQTPGFSPFAITVDTIAEQIVTKTQPAADTKIQAGAKAENILQSSAVSETVQRSEQISQQNSEKGKNSNLPIFGMICMIAILLVAFLFKVDKKP